VIILLKNYRKGIVMPDSSISSSLSHDVPVIAGGIAGSAAFLGWLPMGKIILGSLGYGVPSFVILLGGGLLLGGVVAYGAFKGAEKIVGCCRRENSDFGPLSESGFQQAQSLSRSYSSINGSMNSMPSLAAATTPFPPPPSPPLTVSNVGGGNSAALSLEFDAQAPGVTKVGENTPLVTPPVLK
jgi:hypothetical protein